MKAERTLRLQTREVYQLFERRISDDRLFIDAVLHKINSVIWWSRRHDPAALKVLHEMEQQLNTLTQEFAFEMKRYEDLLSKKKEFKDKRINFGVHFHTKITVRNPISMKLAELIEVYDQLIAILKLLRVARCFETDKAYFIYMKQKQKHTNQTLSRVFLS